MSSKPLRFQSSVPRDAAFLLVQAHDVSRIKVVRKGRRRLCVTNQLQGAIWRGLCARYLARLCNHLLGRCVSRAAPQHEAPTGIQNINRFHRKLCGLPKGTTHCSSKQLTIRETVDHWSSFKHHSTWCLKLLQTHQTATVSPDGPWFCPEHAPGVELIETADDVAGWLHSKTEHSHSSFAWWNQGKRGNPMFPSNQFCQHHQHWPNVDEACDALGKIRCVFGCPCDVGFLLVSFLSFYWLDFNSKSNFFVQNQHVTDHFCCLGSSHWLNDQREVG